MSGVLQPLPDFLAQLLLRLPPTLRVKKYPWDAVGAIVAEMVRAPHALPARNTALQPGFAIIAADSVGASPHAPVLLPRLPERVAIGAQLPGDADAVIDETMLAVSGMTAELTDQAFPGQQVRFAGHDLREGQIIARAGDVFTDAMALAAALSDISAIEIFAPVIAVAPHGDPARDWLCAALRAQGCIIANDAENADLSVRWDDAQPARLALAPGSNIAMGADSENSVLICPPRFDSVFALYAAILSPVIAAMTARRGDVRTAPLARKVSSAIGVSDLVLLQRQGAGMMPLCAGEITLEALLHADAFAILPPESEGLAEGAMIAYTPLSRPLQRSED